MMTTFWVKGFGTVIGVVRTLGSIVLERPPRTNPGRGSSSLIDSSGLDFAPTVTSFGVSRGHVSPVHHSAHERSKIGPGFAMCGLW